MGPLIVGFITTRILRTPKYAPSSKHGVLLQHNAHTRTTTGPPITVMYTFARSTQRKRIFV